MDSRFPRRTKSEGLVTTTLGFNRVYSDVQLHETEEVLEAELRRESCYPSPDEKVARVRLKGEHILHSKHVLLAVVILNLIDCALVLGELILDIHYIREQRTEADMTSQRFIDTLQGKYPDYLHGYDVDNLNHMYEKLYEAHCTWSGENRTQDDMIIPNFHHGDGEAIQHLRQRRSEHGTGVNHGPEYSSLSTGNNVSHHAFEVNDHHHHGHSIWEELAHGMHKTSITILGILFIENIVKVICMGRAFFSKKLEVFDAFVVITSFVVDLVLLKGLNEFTVQDAVFVLTFLLPWRVIRVVNSLIVAVLDQEHFRLKMLYQEKKVVTAELKSLKTKEKKWDFHLHKIEQFCESEGIPKWKIRQHTAMGRKQSTITSMASLALNGFLQGIVLSPSDKELFDRSISQTSQGMIQPNSKDHIHLDVISESDASEDDEETQFDMLSSHDTNSDIHLLQIDNNTGKLRKSESKSTIKSVTFETPMDHDMMHHLLYSQNSDDETRDGGDVK